MSRALAALKSKITKALRAGIPGNSKAIAALIPVELTAGKAYEAYVLGVVCQRLRSQEGCSVTLIGGTHVVLKTSPGPINRSYPHIRVERAGVHAADIWTDVEFSALSVRLGGIPPGSHGTFHEIDVAVVVPGANPRPTPDQILVAVECKNTGYQKHLLREILGVRRELSLLSDPQPTGFNSWPRANVPANPPSCVVVYSTDPDVLRFAPSAAVFGIDLVHEPL